MSSNFNQVSAPERRSLRISQKLPLAIVVAAVLSAAAVGTSNFLKAESAISGEAEEKLLALMEVRRNALSDYLGSIQQDLRIVASNETAQTALTDFTAAWRELGNDPAETLQRLYIDDNPHPTGQKENLDFAQDGSAYSQSHKRYHPWFRTFLRERGYYDIFLFDLDGNLVYTVFKELDYATNLDTGEYKDTDLGNAFRAARDNLETGSQAFFDFKPYAPSHGAPASFISTRMHDRAGRLAGVLVFQMPIDNMNAIMQNSAGLGETGETFIVGSDHLMRSDSRFSDESTILQRSVETTQVQMALEGKTGVLESADHLGEEVVAAFGRLEFLGAHWALVAEAKTDETYQAIAAMRRDTLIYALVSLLIVSALGVLFARGISRPISAMVLAMRQLAEGNRDIQVPALGRGDEIGEMAQAVQVFKETAIEAERMATEKVEQGQRQEQDKRQATLDLADSLDRSIKGVVDTISHSVGQMETVSKSLIATADHTTEQISSVAANSEETAATVQTVAAAAEQLSASIEEIRRQVIEASDIVCTTVDQVKASNSTVKGLAAGAQKIGDVVALINDIAEQTNLLALNATIEAARAGEAGKGFAVVASEVKALANQTAKATEEISAQIDNMQIKTTETVNAIDGVGQGIGRINEFTSSITSAVEQQSAATGEIARNVQDAAAAAQDATRSIDSVSQAAGESGDAAKQVHRTSGELTKQAKLLTSEVSQLLGKLRAS